MMSSRRSLSGGTLTTYSEIFSKRFSSNLSSETSNDKDFRVEAKILLPPEIYSDQSATNLRCWSRGSASMSRIKVIPFSICFVCDAFGDSSPSFPSKTIVGSSPSLSRAKIWSMPHPGSPTNSAGALVVLSTSRSFLSLIAFSVLPSVTKIGSCGDFSREPSLIADDTVERSFCNAMGFSRKEYAPMRVASTAVSIVPCPDIMMTGIVIRPVDDHSLSRVTPSTSGIHISKSTRSGLFFENDSLACVAFSAATTW